MKRWIIMGSYGDKNESGLVSLLPTNYSFQQAQSVLNRMMYAPTNVDKGVIGKAQKIWIEQIDDGDAWWTKETV